MYLAATMYKIFLKLYYSKYNYTYITVYILVIRIAQHLNDILELTASNKSFDFSSFGCSVAASSNVFSLI